MLPSLDVAAERYPTPRGIIAPRGVAKRRSRPTGKHRSALLITSAFPSSIQMHPPLMDTVTVTAMLYQFVNAFGL